MDTRFKFILKHWAADSLLVISYNIFHGFKKLKLQIVLYYFLRKSKLPIFLHVILWCNLLKKLPNFNLACGLDGSYQVAKRFSPRLARGVQHEMV